MWHMFISVSHWQRVCWLSSSFFPLLHFCSFLLPLPFSLTILWYWSCCAWIPLKSCPSNLPFRYTCRILAEGVTAHSGSAAQLQGKQIFLSCKCCALAGLSFSIDRWDMLCGNGWGALCRSRWLPGAEIRIVHGAWPLVQSWQWMIVRWVLFNQSWLVWPLAL